MTGWQTVHTDEGVLPSVSPSEFVGRDRELAVLRRAMADDPGVVLVEGEAGVGKSRLVQELLATTEARRGARSLIAHCPPFRQPHTLSPLVDAVRQAVRNPHDLRWTGLAGVLRPLFPEWAAQLPPVPEAAEDATAARHRVFRALRELLEQLGVDTLVLEDAHWADEATLEFLLFLAAPSVSMSLLVTYRPEDVPETSLLLRLSRFAVGERRLNLDPLDVAATARLVSSMLDSSAVSAEFAQFLYDRTAGIPLAVEESVRLMVDRGDIFYRDGQLARRRLADIAVPPTLRDAVLERVRRLDRRAVAVLWAAAVFADPVDERMLRAMSGLPAAQVRSGLAESLDCGLLVEDGAGRTTIRHVLVGRAVYEAIPSPQRRILHLRAGHALEQIAPPPVARLATHFRGAGETSKWCQYAEQAADIALTPGDEATASALLHELVTRADLPPETVARLTSKIVFMSPPGAARCEELAAALRSALERPGLATGEEAQLRAQLGRVLGIMEDFGGGYAQLERAAPGLPPGSLLAAWTNVILGWPQGAVRPVAAHLRWLRRAPVVTEPLDPAQRLDLAAHRAYGLLALGEQDGWTEAARLPRDAATAPERLVLAVGQMNIGEAAMFWGRYPEARQRFADALTLADRDDHVRCRTIILVQQAHLDWITGAWDGLRERASALADDEDLASVSRLEAALVTGLLDAATGAPAAETLHRVYAELRRRVALESLEPAAVLARLSLATGDVEEALRLTEEPLEIVAGKGFWVHATEVAPARVAALVAAGRVRDAEALVSAFAHGLGDRDAPAPRAALVTCEAMLTEARGDLSDAARGFARAAAAWRALPRPRDALLAREGEARCLLATGWTTAALPLLTEVRQALVSLGATADAERVARELRRHGVTVQDRWRGGRRGYGDRLSPRELEVVQRLAAGCTTQEIAEQLSRSRDTVYSQIRSAMRKLQVTSRTALAMRAVELGIAPHPEARL